MDRIPSRTLKGEIRRESRDEYLQRRFREEEKARLQRLEEEKKLREQSMKLPHKIDEKVEIWKTLERIEKKFDLLIKKLEKEG